jgi:hypothetical protein
MGSISNAVMQFGHITRDSPFQRSEKGLHKSQSVQAAFAIFRSTKCKIPPFLY